MNESGRVLALDAEHVWVETVRKSSCGTCQARSGCGQSLLQSMHPERSDSLRLIRQDSLCADLKIGDTVDFSVPDHLISRSAALLYLMPLLLMLLAVIVVENAGFSDVLVAAAGMATLALGFMASHLYFSRDDQQQLLPTIVAVHPVAVHSVVVQESTQSVKLL